MYSPQLKTSRCCLTLPSNLSCYVFEQPASGEVDHQLTLENVTENDAGVYTCFVASVHGNTHVSAWLIVQNAMGNDYFHWSRPLFIV